MEQSPAPEAHCGVGNYPPPTTTPHRAMFPLSFGSGPFYPRAPAGSRGGSVPASPLPAPPAPFSASPPAAGRPALPISPPPARRPAPRPAHALPRAPLFAVPPPGFVAPAPSRPPPLIVGEMAMALVLLTGAGLMIRSLTRLWSVDAGFNPHNLLNFGVSLPPSMMKASPDAIRAAFRDLDHRLASIPGVTAVSQTWGAIPIGPDDEQLFWLQGQPKPESDHDMNWAVDYIVGPDYLKAMGIPLLSGRFLASQDNEHAPLVVVIDDVLAAKYFPNENPIGKGIQLKTFTGPAQVVGVVGHVKQWGLDQDDVQTPRAQLYLACPQMPDEFIAMAPSGASVMVRTAANTSGLLDSIRRLSRQMSSQQVIFGAQSMDEIIADSLASQRFSMIILGAFAGLALLLASIGIYGVISYVVGQRTHEIGIRMALGASRVDILRLVLGSNGRLTLIGVGVGVAAALGLTRLMARLLYGVSAPLFPTFFFPFFIIYFPARRASRVDPMVALRYE